MKSIIQPNVMYTFRIDEARARIDNLLESVRNYIGKGRVYTERDLCRIYYKVKRNDPVWKPDDRYNPYRRDELVSMACDWTNALYEIDPKLVITDHRVTPL